MNSRVGLLLACLLSGLAVSTAQGAAAPVVHSPEQPKSGETVRITARLGPDAPRDVTLQYQVIEPGRYIALADSDFAKKWVSLPMTNETKGKGVFTAELPGALQVHRRLVRYRVAAEGRVIAPGTNVAGQNFAYFVYDGVPAWRGAVNPASPEPAQREKVVFGTNVMRSLPVYQLLTTKAAVENVTWLKQASWGNERARKAYDYTGTFIADDGRVYDHVRFRARGGEWRYTTGKTMWKFDFNRGQHLQARDDFGRAYETKWEKLNLGACIQHGDYGRRGEQGMYESVGFALFNLAGVQAPFTHWIHLRIITGREEDPVNQYEGDFWGLYLATEDMDDHFLKEHDLPPGNLYKMQPSPELHSKTPHALPDNGDVRRFMADFRRPQPERWWRENVDLARYYSYRSIVECIHNYDIYNGKNYFYYLNPQSQRWSVLPWDIDHSWGDGMHGTGMEPFHQIGLTAREPFSIEYGNRLREIRNLLFNPQVMDPFIDERAAILSDPRGGASFAEADRIKWDFHPAMNRHTWKGGQGRFYQAAPTKDFRGMVQMMKDYVRTRGAWVDSTLLHDAGLPPAPSVSGSFPDFHTVTTNEVAGARLEWRLADITPAKAQVSFEIKAVWQTNGSGNKVQMPPQFALPGHRYRVRARAVAADGRAGHWSAPVEFEPPRAR